MKRAMAAVVGAAAAVASLVALWVYAGSPTPAPAGTGSGASASAASSPAAGGAAAGLAGGTAPGATVPGPAPAVLPGVTSSAPVPSRDRLQALLAPLLADPRLGPSVSADVVDPETGEHLAGLASDAEKTPASTIKVLTAAAALSALGPQTTLTTKVVAGSTPDEIILVGGGDVLLAAGKGDPAMVDGHAGLGDLAALTARALQASGRTQVAVRLDDALFTGPAVSNDWSGNDVSNGFVAPVMALEINAGRAGSSSRRSADPALTAATVFAGALGRDGIGVVGPVVRAQADPGAAVLAQVESATVADQVEYTLTESDNTAAEALARLVAARSGRPATFDDAGAAVLDRIDLLGIPTVGARMVGGSGLGTEAQVSAAILTGVLSMAATQQHPELRPLLTGLPVAAASGTLETRFLTPSQRAAAGVVRAKTGTLATVHSLAGTVVDADGRLLVFAVLADAVPRTAPALRVIDTVAATLAGCGCS